MLSRGSRFLLKNKTFTTFAKESFLVACDCLKGFAKKSNTAILFIRHEQVLERAGEENIHILKEKFLVDSKTLTIFYGAIVGICYVVLLLVIVNGLQLTMSGKIFITIFGVMGFTFFSKKWDRFIDCIKGKDKLLEILVIRPRCRISLPSQAPMC
jgi:hypothetical protein